ncbi:alpha/beta-hydrolase [Dendrothele bispora CBS 962.96]|uniref:Alpha/beta-hydrolase n=1 Tax=Dendrothele bispora (strain CBS 962.96) TaxID=1314807 RepID=A0A4V6T5S8_DENBC|nr:alpha/beta-hydrolase [Dendrothele bispora CBS 962.96]
MIYIQDKRLTLRDGRCLAYADNGNTSSKTVILFLHGAFSVGDASRLTPVLQSKNTHLICPSLPGWGTSSPVADITKYARTIAHDMSVLLSHLHPDLNHLKLYICGHSLGAVTARILYDSPYNLFSYGRCISGLILLSPHPAPHNHRDYAKHLSWLEYLVAGPPARYLPFNLTARVVKGAIQKKLKSEEDALQFIRQWLFDPMKEDELERFMQWKEESEVEDGQFESCLARNAMESVASTWQGFMDIAEVYHSGWSNSRRDEHREVPIKILEGGHLSTLFRLDDVWRELLA